MVTRVQIEANRKAIEALKFMLDELIYLHDTALFTYRTDGVDKYLPDVDIDALILKYQTKKGEVITKFQGLL